MRRLGRNCVAGTKSLGELPQQDEDWDHLGLPDATLAAVPCFPGVAASGEWQAARLS